MPKMSGELIAHALKRQNGDGSGGDGGVLDGDDWGYYGDTSDDQVSWWWTPAGMAVRYVVVAAIFALILLFCLGGYWHGRRRLRKGLPPLAYHRWMVQRHMQTARPQQYAEYRVSSSGGDGYQMEHYAPPPPAYNAADVPPPVYQPPEGTSKVAAEQSGTVHVQPLPPTPREDGAASEQQAAGERV